MSKLVLQISCNQTGQVVFSKNSSQRQWVNEFINRFDSVSLKEQILKFHTIENRSQRNIILPIELK